jgi:hypothetical protein
MTQKKLRLNSKVQGRYFNLDSANMLCLTVSAELSAS